MIKNNKMLNKLMFILAIAMYCEASSSRDRDSFNDDTTLPTKRMRLYQDHVERALKSENPVQEIPPAELSNVVKKLKAQGFCVSHTSKLPDDINPSLIQEIKNIQMEETSDDKTTAALQVFIKDSDRFLTGIGLHNDVQLYKTECFSIQKIECPKQLGLLVYALILREREFEQSIDDQVIRMNFLGNLAQAGFYDEVNFNLLNDVRVRAKRIMHLFP